MDRRTWWRRTAAVAGLAASAWLAAGCGGTSVSKAAAPTTTAASATSATSAPASSVSPASVAPSGTTAASGATTTTASSPPASASGCANLTATASVKAALVTANSAPGAVNVPGSTYYGRCGATFYAVSSFGPSATATEQQQVAFQDDGSVPKFFVQQAGGSWSEVGDTGFPSYSTGCSAFKQVPPPLLALWHDCA